MDTLTLTLNGRSSILTAQYYPPIELSLDKNYVLGLIELLTFNSIPNIDEEMNKFYVGNREIVIPTGSYEVEDIEKYLQSRNVNISIKSNNNTLRCNVTCDEKIDFKPSDSIGRLLGFAPRILEANTEYESDLPVTILKINSIRVECNITTGAFINKGHTIHEFFPNVPPGYKIVESPPHVIYLPVAVRAIDSLQLKIVDQDDNLINFRGEIITIRLHIKSV